jgi:ABC-type nitrate/sulfonate/bicarbonate transport system substrate-binding protein
MSPVKLHLGFIPLVDAAALIVAADHGFAGEQDLAIELVREVSWSNVRDKLNIGLFDAAHLLSPVAIASSLGIGHVRVPIVAPFNLGLNGNAITLSPWIYAALAEVADGNIDDPMMSARALAKVIADRKARDLDPLTFGMTFPFSNHNYQLRFWMAAGGVDPDEDVRMVVLPPPYMVDSLTSGQVDGFCVGAPWNSVAVEAGVGRILHFGSEIMARVSEKVLAVRAQFANSHPDVLAALVRALTRAGEFIADPANRMAVAAALSRRLDVPAEIIALTLSGELELSADGATRSDQRYIMIGGAVSRPDPVQAAWLYAQMVRWGQAPLSEDARVAAHAVFRPDLFDAATGVAPALPNGGPRDGVGAFVGPEFSAADVAGYVAGWRAKPSGRPRLSIVR